MITIIDYGMGNLGSIFNMFKYLGIESSITSDFKEIDNASKIILPGVGAFDKAIINIKNLNLFDLIKKKALIDKIPFLGICLGMQLLTNKSEEGNLKGFGFIDGEVKKFRFNDNQRLKIPHMGWNDVVINKHSNILSDLPESPRYYFVHSYYVKVNNENDSILKTHYEITFDSGIRKDNIIGFQFHPEKSHKYGMTIFENFAKM